MNFWGKKSYKEMKLEHDLKMYPPKVAITISKSIAVQKIRVMFSNLTEEDDLDMEVFLCQGTYCVAIHVYVKLFAE